MNKSSAPKLVYSPRYVRLLPQEYAEIKTDLFLNNKNIIIQNIEKNKKVILCDIFFDSNSYLNVRLFNFQRSDPHKGNIFASNTSIFELQKGEPLAYYFILEKG